MDEVKQIIVKIETIKRSYLTTSLYQISLRDRETTINNNDQIVSYVITVSINFKMVIDNKILIGYTIIDIF